ncbi:CrcB protein [Alloactinosynnema sp. L-07]|uniref:fluoride efflux transporter CrcB n=1 Tax=Alloactinosynnema sp. L-07 TaxID=1653480 RepID=UPI00065F0A07|nr:fluoride efflux transporter CrcB [Alloactinosynnema sp. L-07]CRK55629.1 CrcB protein [Alloactinosynnema sp. L-07]
MTVLLVALGAAVGAPARYLVDRALRGRFGHGFPWGTLVVNIVGSGVLGALAGVSTATNALLGVGFCGALTTYSTFGYETVRLLEDSAYRKAFANVAVSVVAGIGAAAVGHALSVPG